MSDQKYVCSYYINDERGVVRADIFSDDNVFIVKYFDESQTFIWGETRKCGLDEIADTLNESVYA